MAAASSSTTFFHLTFLWLYLLVLLMICVHLPSASSFSFSLDFSKTGDPCGRELVCKGDASFRSSMIELTRNDGDSSYSRGLVWYATPVPLWNAGTSEVASFTTTFSFDITRIRNSPGWGDGMAFFLARYTQDSVLDNTYGAGLLGLFKFGRYFDVTGDGRVVAVEFDTVLNPEWDNSSQHVGIDVNSIKSMSYTNTSSPEMNDKNLTSGFTMTATVRYDNRSKLLAVDLRIDDTLYRVNATVDLKKELPKEVAVGFSAGTGDYYELHRILSWSFNSSLEAEKVSSNRTVTMSPAPAPASKSLPDPAVKSEPSDKLLLKVLVPIASASVFSAIVVCLLLWLRWKPRRTGNADFDMGMVVGPRRYTYDELAAATDNFAEGNKLGQGGFGSVYKGRLLNDANGAQLVAIKKFSAETSSQGRKEFEAEVKIISRLRHRNLVQLLGWCDSPKGLLLVYELVPEGSLDKHIHDNPRLLTWSERYKIILGLGSALRYLHQEWEQCVVHCDIKPSNIMLDSSYNTKLGDFGLARLIDHGSDPQTTALVQGTIGYMDPEFVYTNRRSAESDVYSFGIVLLEIVSGRPPLDRWDPSFELSRWVWSLYSQGATLDAADARLRPRDDHDAGERRQMERALVVGLLCAQHDQAGRPSVAQAMHALQSEDATALPMLTAHMYRAAEVAPAGFTLAESGGFVRSLSRGARSPATARTTPSSE